MKNQYITPEIEVSSIEITNTILAGSSIDVDQSTQYDEIEPEVKNGLSWDYEF